MKPFFRRLGFVLCIGWLAGTHAASALEAIKESDARKLALINEMFEVTHADALMQQTMQQMEAAQKAQLAKMDAFRSNPELADKIWTKMYALIAERLSWDKIKPDMVKLYADNFTEEELSATLNFYKTPAGQAMLKKMPVVMSGAIKITQEKMGDLMPEIQRIVRDAVADEPDDSPDAKPDSK